MKEEIKGKFWSGSKGNTINIFIILLPLDLPLSESIQSLKLSVVCKVLVNQSFSLHIPCRNCPVRSVPRKCVLMLRAKLWKVFLAVHNDLLFDLH